MMVTCPALAELNGIRHGFFTRHGGVSSGLYTSLNCGYGSGDAAEYVTENRMSAANTLGRRLDDYCPVYQIHSADAMIAETPWAWEHAPKADAIVSNTPGLLLGILTADCLPVLFADPVSRVIGAAHAGWKGAFSGIIEATLAAMATLGAKNEQVIATIGPAIAQGSYEVGDEFHARFVAQAEENAIYFLPGARAGHYLFDLKAYAKDRLKNAGVSQINLLAQDTCLEENDFFSYRRATLRGETHYGRQLSAITL